MVALLHDCINLTTVFTIWINFSSFLSRIPWNRFMDWVTSPKGWRTSQSYLIFTETPLAGDKPTQRHMVWKMFSFVQRTYLFTVLKLYLLIQIHRFYINWHLINRKSTCNGMKYFVAKIQTMYLILCWYLMFGLCCRYFVR